MKTFRVIIPVSATSLEDRAWWADFADDIPAMTLVTISQWGALVCDVEAADETEAFRIAEDATGQGPSSVRLAVEEFRAATDATARLPTPTSFPLANLLGFSAADAEELVRRAVAK